MIRYTVAVALCLALNISAGAQSITLDNAKGGTNLIDVDGTYSTAGKGFSGIYPQYYDDVNKEWKYFPDFKYQIAPFGKAWSGTIQNVAAGTYKIRVEMKYPGGSVKSGEKTVTVNGQECRARIPHGQRKLDERNVVEYVGIQSTDLLIEIVRHHGELSVITS